MVIHEEFRKGNEAPAASNLEFITPSITTFCKYSKETKGHFYKSPNLLKRRKFTTPKIDADIRTTSTPMQN